MRTKPRPVAEPAHDDAIEHLVHTLTEHLTLRACWFEPFPFDQELPRIETHAVVIPADEPGLQPYSSWSPDDGIELPVRHSGLPLGRFVLVPKVATCGVAIPPSLRADAIAVARRAGDLLARPNAFAQRASSERGTSQ